MLGGKKPNILSKKVKTQNQKTATTKKENPVLLFSIFFLAIKSKIYSPPFSVWSHRIWMLQGACSSVPSAVLVSYISTIFSHDILDGELK